MAQPEAIPLPMEFAASVIDPATGKAMEYRELIRNPGTKSVWQRSSANEFDRLCDGHTGRVNGTNTDKICMMTTRLACNRAIESSYWRMDNNSDVGLLMGYVLYWLPIELESIDLDTFSR
jgi:hypothetical protein